MGTRLNLYVGQPATTNTTLVTSPASTTTTITYARAYNTGTDTETLDVYFGSTRLARGIVLGPYESITIFPFLGMVLDATDTIGAAASTATTISIKIDGYQVTT